MRGWHVDHGSWFTMVSWCFMPLLRATFNVNIPKSKKKRKKKSCHLCHGCGARSFCSCQKRIHVISWDLLDLSYQTFDADFMEIRWKIDGKTWENDRKMLGFESWSGSWCQQSKNRCLSSKHLLALGRPPGLPARRLFLKSGTTSYHVLHCDSDTM